MSKNISIIKIYFVIIISFLISNHVNADTGYEILILRPSENISSEHLQYKNALSSIGLNSRIISIPELIGSKLLESENPCVKVLIIPAESAMELDQNEADLIVRKVKDGLNLITEQHTLLSDALGIKFKLNSFSISGIKDLRHPDVAIRWRNIIKAEEFENKGMEIFCKEAKSNKPVLTGGKSGNGKYLFFSVKFDDKESFGYGRFPYFHEVFTDYFCIRPSIKRNRLVAYLDLGYHDEENLPVLAQKMKSYGINEVHISSWYSVERFDSKYKDLIQKCHENGILVYMWLEFPMVTEEFWDIHPEWREKTAQLKDAALDWRKLMALENPDCFDAVTSYLSSFINNYEWDGIDLAEFYFESLEGYKHPDHFTPMSSFVRKEFETKYGFDPKNIFIPGNKYYYSKNYSAINNFIEYRIDLCTRLNREILTFLKNVRSMKPLDIYLTQIANPFDEKLNRNIGVEVDNFIKLQKEFGFTMQAEDPYPLWVLGPERYKKIGDTYRKLLGNDPTLTIDINIVDEGRDNPYPTNVQTGLEFTELLSVASQNADRVCIYAVNTPYEYDYKYAAYALASNCSIGQLSPGEFKTKSSRSFIFELDSSVSEAYLNSEPWKCFGSNYVIIPSGENKLKVIYGPDKSKGFLVLRDITCEIFSYKGEGGNIELSYNENRNVYITLNKRPAEVFLNNKKISPIVYYNSEKENYVVCCPGGQNKIRLIE